MWEIECKSSTNFSGLPTFTPFAKWLCSLSPPLESELDWWPALANGKLWKWVCQFWAWPSRTPACFHNLSLRNMFCYQETSPSQCAGYLETHCPVPVSPSDTQPTTRHESETTLAKLVLANLPAKPQEIRANPYKIT